MKLEILWRQELLSVAVIIWYTYFWPGIRQKLAFALDEAAFRFSFSRCIIAACDELWSVAYLKLRMRWNQSLEQQKCDFTPCFVSRQQQSRLLVIWSVRKLCGNVSVNILANDKIKLNSIFHRRLNFQKWQSNCFQPKSIQLVVWDANGDQLFDIDCCVDLSDVILTESKFKSRSSNKLLFAIVTLDGKVFSYQFKFTES